MIKTFLDSFSELLFPELNCFNCGREISGGGVVCPVCDKSLERIENACLKCGAEVVGGGEYCQRCKREPLAFDGAFSVTAYKGFAKNVVSKYKDGKKFLAPFIAAQIAELIKNSQIQFDIITFVPVGQKSFKKRGFDQSRLLAELTAKELNVSVEPLLLKAKETDKQKMLSYKERKENLKGAFAVTDKVAVKGKSVLIIDDIMTTGYTLSECAETLKKAKAKKVFCAVFSATWFESVYE